MSSNIVFVLHSKVVQILAVAVGSGHSAIESLICCVILSLTPSFPQVVIVGNGAVGKSSMIQKYCKGIFTAEYKKTIGVDFLEKMIR